MTEKPVSPTSRLPEDERVAEKATKLHEIDNDDCADAAMFNNDDCADGAMFENRLTPKKVAQLIDQKFKSS